MDNTLLASLSIVDIKRRTVDKLRFPTYISKILEQNGPDRRFFG